MFRLINWIIYTNNSLMKLVESALGGEVGVTGGYMPYGAGRRLSHMY